MKKLNQRHGITLISLVITIILLLILAGIVINLTLGENGIIKMAEKAGKNYINAEEHEQTQLEEFTNEANKIIANKNKKLVSQITAKDYGKEINYSVTVNGTELSDWKVFYNDGNNVYIIKSDYLDNSLIPNSTGIKKTGKYVAYWEKSINNKSAAETLTNTNNWSEFASGKAGETATGGPTIEMYVASWNEKGYTKLYTSTNSTGYLIGTTKNQTTTEVNMSDDIVGYSDILYYPYKDICESCNSYWIASPSAYDTDCLLFLDYIGRIGYYRVYHSTTRNSSSSMLKI